MRSTGQGPSHTPRSPWVLAALLGSILLSGCSGLGYYAQAIEGHLQVMGQRTPIATVASDPDTDPRLRAHLERTAAIRRYASDRLGLPDNGSYTRYADIGRRFVVWNVVAAPPLSLQAHTWCYPLIGCASYRGYFREAEARALAQQLEHQGYDVHVGGVQAYSTLGWFDDPVLNTWPLDDEAEVARLIFHELSHQILYVADDTEFNESFASAVEQIGLQRWLDERQDPTLNQRWQQHNARREQWYRLMRTARADLLTLYASGVPAETQLQRKQQRLLTLEQQLLDQFTPSGQTHPQINNATLATIHSYERWIPALMELYRQNNQSLPAFYQAARELAALDRETRAARLQQLDAGTR